VQGRGVGVRRAGRFARSRKETEDGGGRDGLISRYAVACGSGWGRDDLISRYALASGLGFVARGNRMLAHGG
jgi:hypothetical protein